MQADRNCPKKSTSCFKVKGVGWIKNCANVGSNKIMSTLPKVDAKQAKRGLSPGDKG